MSDDGADARRQWSTEVPHTSRPPAHPSGGQGNVRRSHDPFSSPALGADGVRTLYEGAAADRTARPFLATVRAAPQTPRCAPPL